MNTEVRAVLAAVLYAASTAAFAQAGAEDPDALRGMKPIFDSRLRLEQVEQAPLPRDAEAVTWRAHLGFETPKAWSTSLLVEGEFLWPLTGDYNSTTNGKAAYPVVADPESHEVNRLQLTNTSIPLTTVTLGRQKIVLDDHRFVGDVGWRQNEQTFDSLRVATKPLEALTIDAAYVTQANRVFGKDSPQGRYEGDSALLNVSYQTPVGKLTAFGYWIDIEALAAAPAAVRDSSRTYGVRFSGERPLDAIKISYLASYASQSEYADNPLAFDLDYVLVELKASYRQYSLGVGQEMLEGDGAKGFTTPFATLHRFQGWADKFLATPADGVQDRYVTAGIALKAVGPIETLTALAAYHWYEAERTSSNYGKEINAQVQARWGRFTGLIKYADYDARRLFTDTTKFWVQLEYAW